MSNGARHVLGLVAGLIMTPLITAGLLYGVSELTRSYRMFVTPWVGVGVLVVTAVLFGLLVGSRISPIASLIAGLGYTLLGALPPLVVALGLDPNLGASFLPRDLLVGYNTLMFSGLFLLLGITLLTVSVLPSRWRSSQRALPPTPPQQQQYYPQPKYNAPAEPYSQQQPPPLPTRQLPTYPQQDPPVDPHDSTRPINRD